MKYIRQISYALILTALLAGLASAQQTRETAENYYKLGVTALESKRYDQAVEYFTTAIGVIPDFKEAFLERSKARHFKRDFANALLDAEQAIKLDPQFGEAYFQRANIRSLTFADKLNQTRNISADQITRNYQLILDDLDASIKFNYKTVEVYLARGAHICNLMKRCGEAIPDFDAALRLKPGDTEILQKRSVAKYRSGDTEAAAADQREIIEQKNQKIVPVLQSERDVLAVSAAIAQIGVDVHLEKFDEFNRNEKFVEAIAEITEAIKLQPANPQLYSKRMYVARLTQNADLIEQDALKLIELQPADFENVNQAVHSLLSVNRCPTALNILNSVIAQDPVNAAAFNLRSGVKNCLEDFPGAMDDNDRAIGLDPLNELYKAQRANLLARQNKAGESIAAYDSVINNLELKLSITKDPTDLQRLKINLSLTYISRSRLFAKQENVTAAFADLDRAIEVFPAAHTYQIRGKANRWQKMYDKAISDYTEAIKLEPEHFGLFLERGDIYFLMEKYAEALADYEKASGLTGQIREIVDEKIKKTKDKMQQK